MDLNQMLALLSVSRELHGEFLTASQNAAHANRDHVRAILSGDQAGTEFQNKRRSLAVGAFEAALGQMEGRKLSKSAKSLRDGAQPVPAYSMLLYPAIAVEYTASLLEYGIVTEQPEPKYGSITAAEDRTARELIEAKLQLLEGLILWSATAFEWLDLWVAERCGPFDANDGVLECLQKRTVESFNSANRSVRAYAEHLRIWQGAAHPEWSALLRCHLEFPDLREIWGDIIPILPRRSEAE